MKLRQWLKYGFMASLFVFSAHAGAADNYPSKPIRLVVSFPPGGVADIMARDYAQELSQTLGQTVVVENRPGAGTTIGADYVSKAPADGYTLFLTNIGHSISAAYYKKLPYNVETDFSPVSLLADVPSVLATHTDFPANNVVELIDYAKKNPGVVNFASAGNGTGSHLYGEFFKIITGIDMVHVPYKGTAPAFTDLISGRVNLIFEPVGTMMPHLASGKTKALGVTTAKRVKTLPDVPPIADSGLPEFDLSTWYGILAPKNTPRDIVNKVNKALVDITHSPKMTERFESQGTQPVGSSPDEFEAVIKKDVERWKAVMDSAGLERV